MKNDLLIWAKREFLNSLQTTTHYQPIINTYTLEIFGYEALSRFAIKGESLPVQRVFQDESL